MLTDLRIALAYGADHVLLEGVVFAALYRICLIKHKYPVANLVPMVSFAIAECHRNAVELLSFARIRLIPAT